MFSRHNNSFNRRQFLAAATSTFAAGCSLRDQSAIAFPLPSKPNLIVWLADSLRADRLPCYGCPMDTAPHISRFAAASTVFDACYAAATWTTPATISLLTGVPPLLHRTIVPEWSDEGRTRGGQHQVLAESIPTTATLLQAAGYDTAQFQANPNATGEHGIGKGFNHYFYKLNAGYKEHTDAFLAWLRTEAREPFYAYIHLIDPHEPYSPDPEIFKRLHGQTIEERLGRLPAQESSRLRHYHRQTWNGLFLDNKRPGPEELVKFSSDGIAYLDALYSAEIRGMDAQFGRLIDTLEETGLRDRTVVAVTSDHGEAFGEDDLYYHGSGLHDPQIRIPLMIGLPGTRHEARCATTVSQCDIHPTLLNLAGVSTVDSYGNVLLDRSGRLPGGGGRAALSSLDLSQSDPKRWRYRLTAGDIQVESTEDFRVTRVTRQASPGPVQSVQLEEVRSLKDAPTREAVEYFYTERHYLNELAARHPLPGWWTPAGPDDGALKALGYL